MALFAINGNIAVAQQGDGSPAFAEIVRFIDEQGWRVDFGRLCTQFDILGPNGSCVFKQVSVQEIEGRIDPRGFNVPTEGNAGAPYVFLFHLGPLVGEFFILSREGEFVKAFYRRKGGAYEALPKSDVEDELKSDIAYWLANFSRIKQGVQDDRARRK